MRIFMNIVKVSILSFSLIIGHASYGAENTEPQQNKTGEIREQLPNLKKVNDNLYVYQFKPGLYFVMEKYTEDNKENWHDYYKNQKEKITKLSDQIRDISEKFRKSNVYKEAMEAYEEAIDKRDLEGTPIPDDVRNPKELLDEHIYQSIPQLREYRQIIASTGGLGCFNYTLDDRDQLLMTEEGKNPSETWVVYALATTEEPTDFYNPAKDLNNVEMAMATSTAKGIPFLSNMGIARAPTYSSKKHPPFSVYLHAFAAAVIKDMYPEKVYMITVPEETKEGGKSMESILKDAFKGKEEAFWAGDNINDLTATVHPAVIIKENFGSGMESCPNSRFLPQNAKWLLNDQKGQTILTLDYGDLQKNSWFFCHRCIQATTTTVRNPERGLHYVTVDLDYLIPLLHAS